MVHYSSEYLAQISKHAFGGVPIHPLDGTLHQAGAEKVVITSSAPASESYIFGVHSGHLAKSRYVVLGARNDRLVFKLPASIFTDYAFSEDSKTGRIITNVFFDPHTLSWYLTHKKGPLKQDSRLSIDRYKVELMEDMDRIALCVGLQAALGMR